MRFKAAAFRIVWICVVWDATPSSAQTILSNLPGTGTYVAGSFVSGNFSKGVGLTLGSTDLLFQTMDAIMSNPAAQGSNILSGGIYSDSGGNPGFLLAGFDPFFIPTGSENITVTMMTTDPFTLLAGTSYWFVLNEPFNEPLDWQRDDANTAPTATGAAWNGYRFTNNGGMTWAASSVFNTMSINAAPVPEPAPWALLAAGAGLLVAFARRRR